MSIDSLNRDLNQAALTIKNLSIVNKTDYLLENISYRFAKGRVSVFLGREEEEKCAMLRSLGGSLRNYVGTIEVFGKDSREYPEVYAPNLIMVSDSMCYEFPRTILELHEHLNRYFQNWDAALYSQTINVFGLNASSHFSDLTDRQKKQVLCAVALASNLPILIFECIESYINPNMEEFFYKTLREKANKGCCIILSSSRISIWKEQPFDLYRIKNARLYRIDQDKLCIKSWSKEKNRIKTPKGFGEFTDHPYNTASSITMTSLSTDL